jgi:hypothetical protein
MNILKPAQVQCWKPEAVSEKGSQALWVSALMDVLIACFGGKHVCASLPQKQAVA